MFNLFKTPDVLHPVLGTLKWRHGCWRGETKLPSGQRVELVLGGTRGGPDPTAVIHAQELSSNIKNVEVELSRALFEHYEPYAEAATSGHIDASDSPPPNVTGPEHALQLAKPEAVAIVALDGELATEVCYSVPWDEEHIVGARFRGSQWVELCGSTIIP